MPCVTEAGAPRVAIGGIIHESHSFAEEKADLTAFERQSLHYGDDILHEMAGTRAAIGGMIERAAELGWSLRPTAYGAAMPAGVVEEAAYQEILQELLERLRAAMPVDGVLLALHGAMVTEEHLDAESDILARVREVVGPEVPIVVELDMHGNISPETVELADVLVAFDTNPHIDPHARGRESADILESILRGGIQPMAAYVQPPLMLSAQATGTGDLPLRAVHERRAEMEAEDEVVCICVMGGYAYADTPNTGPSIIVTTDNDLDLARRYAQELVDILLENRDASLPDFLPAAEAVAQAAAQPAGPIMLVDSADNIGGGTPGDGTDALRAMVNHPALQQGEMEAAVVIADPEAVAICWEAGEGNQVTVTVGGKVDRWHGDPVEVTGTVRALSDGTFECELPDNHFASFFGNVIHMGRTVWLQAGGVNIVLTERKIPPFDLAQLRGVGVIPEQQQMIAVKSAVAYRAAYMPIAQGVIEMDTAGLCSANLTRFPYQHVRRPLWPLDPQPSALQTGG
jgi:microcystin degradation protein MlrC